MEDKYGQSSKKRKRTNGAEDSESGSEGSSSDSESEDDEGELATEALDAEIIATLKAIRSKDPRVYDPQVKFYTDEAGNVTERVKTEKPMYLRDYHREKLLSGADGNPVNGETQPRTYEQEQADLKASIVKEIHNAGADGGSEDDDDSGSDSGFLKAIEKPTQFPKAKVPKIDVDNADRDPETFLSNFMSSRAWAANESSHLQPFESDDEDEEKRAEEFEEAYNFRFEDPAKSNEKLLSHARVVAEKSSVRR